jgi:hypothetical protein
MSLYDYRQSIELEDAPFYALIMAAMRRADPDNLRLLRNAFPIIWNELTMRYNAPGGVIEGDEYALGYEVVEDD